MTRTENSLLLYFETCAVDHRGLIAGSRINGEDIAIAKGWNDSGFVRFGRIASESLGKVHSGGQPATHWCRLSEDAWEKAHFIRRERAARMEDSLNLPKVIRLGLDC